MKAKKWFFLIIVLVVVIFGGVLVFNIYENINSPGQPPFQDSWVKGFSYSFTKVYSERRSDSLMIRKSGSSKFFDVSACSRNGNILVCQEVILYNPYMKGFGIGIGTVGVGPDGGSGSGVGFWHSSPAVMVLADRNYYILRKADGESGYSYVAQFLQNPADNFGAEFMENLCKYSPEIAESAGVGECKNSDSYVRGMLGLVLRQVRLNYHHLKGEPDNPGVEFIMSSLPENYPGDKIIRDVSPQMLLDSSLEPDIKTIVQAYLDK